VHPADKPAIFVAILLEAAKEDVPHAQAAEGLLAIDGSLGDAVPREDWHMLPRKPSPRVLISWITHASHQGHASL
jgi:hypothetical protein